MQMRNFLIALTAAAIFTGSAHAADLRPYTKAPAAVPVYNWTGFYVGLNGGWIGSADTEFLNTGTDWSAGGLGTKLAVGVIPTTFRMGRESAMVGGTAGYNWQLGPLLVLGIEADLDYIGARRTIAFNGIFTGSPSTTNYLTQLDYLGTVRGRVGALVAPSLMIFGTGGLAYGGARLGSQYVCDTCLPPASTEASTNTVTDKIMTGWTVGAGVEWMFAPNISAKAEYLYLDLGRISNTIMYDYGADSSLTTTHRERDHIARVGINYKWGGPVVARY